MYLLLVHWSLVVGAEMVYRNKELVVRTVDRSLWHYVGSIHEF